jgi:hypothetical protein
LEYTKRVHKRRLLVENCKQNQLADISANLGRYPSGALDKSALAFDCLTQSKTITDALTMSSHKFKIGETVILKPAISRNIPGGACEVIKQLPHNGHEFEYRIKSVGVARRR